MECTQCHTIVGRLRPDYVPLWICNPRRFKTTTEMPSFEGTNDELTTIVEYLLTVQ